MRTLPRYVSLSIGVVAIAGLVALFFLFPKSANATGTPITGWGWSDGIGWISMNCSNTSSCGTSNYGLSIDSSGNITGYAWSDNIGWISANPSDLTGCPSGTCTATVDATSGVFSGWLRAIEGSGAQHGASDGWISLNGSSPAYGPVDSNTGTISGYAWGSNSIGWVDFSRVTTTYLACARNTTFCRDTSTVRYINNSCVYTDTSCPYASYGYGCVSGACTSPPPAGPGTVGPGSGNGGGTQLSAAIIVKPALIHTNSTVQVIWSVTNVDATTCSVTGSNGDSWLHMASSSATGMTSSAISSPTRYTLTCQTTADISTYSAVATVTFAPDFREK